MSKPRCLWFTPTSGAICPQAVETYWMMRPLVQLVDLDWSYSDWCLLPESRNHALVTAINKGYDYLLMQDSDVSVDIPDSADTMCAIDMLVDSILNVPDVVAAAAVVRQTNFFQGPNARMFVPGQVDPTGVPKPALVYKGLKVVQSVDAVGTAFMLIDVKQAMFIKFPWFVAIPLMSPSGEINVIGEDCTFCFKAKHAGLQTVVNAPIKTTHHNRAVGPLKWDMKAWEAAPPIEHGMLEVTIRDLLCCLPR